MKGFGKTVGGVLDKAGRQADTALSKAAGMEDGNKISHAANHDSSRHKEAARQLAGTEKDDAPVAAPAAASAPASSDESHGSTVGVTASHEVAHKDDGGIAHSVTVTGETGGETGEG